MTIELAFGPMPTIRLVSTPDGPVPVPADLSDWMSERERRQRIARVRDELAADGVREANRRAWRR